MSNFKIINTHSGYKLQLSLTLLERRPTGKTGL